MKALQLIFLVIILAFTSACEIMPRNSLKDCVVQCKDSKKPEACKNFCECIHNEGQPLDSCLAKYDKAPVEIKKP